MSEDKKVGLNMLKIYYPKSI